MKSSGKKIFKVGVTGGIGSGKSTVCEIFSRLGVPVLRSDDMAKELTASDTGVRKKMIELLGSQAYLSNGQPDRTFIASQIFSDKSLQQKVEAIVHPVVERERERWFDDLRSQGQWIAIVEAALIYEAGIDRKLDVVVVVDAEEPLRIQRACARMGISEKEVRVRIDAQLDVKKKLEKAEYIVQNNGTLEELESKVRFLYTIFRQLAYEGKRV